MVENSRVVFIVGFERCMTSSLASYLVHNGYCSLLVNGIKEPKVFSSDPYLAAAILRRRTSVDKCWSLDASVNYVLSPKALAAILGTVEDYRIIVCLRNQFQRTVSAYQLYQGTFTIKTASVSWHDWPFCIEFGDAKMRSAAANDSLALPRLRVIPRGQYVHTAIAAFSEGISQDDSETLSRYDSAAAAFAAESFPIRVVRELQHFRRTGSFPLISILHNSYFARPLENLLKVFDERRVLVVTLQDKNARERLDSSLATFIGSTPRLCATLPHILASDQFGISVSAHDRVLGEEGLRPSLLDDTRKTVTLLESYPQLDLSLFSPTALY